MKYLLLVGFVLALFGCDYGYSWQDKGQALTKQFEGFEHKPYIDTLGVKTIGYGFNCEYMPSCEYISRTQADKLFKDKYTHAQARAEKFVGSAWSDLSDNEKIVLVDMSYNLGNRLFSFKRFKKAIVTRDDKLMITEMQNSKWYTQTGNRPEKLISILGGTKWTR